MHRPPAPDTARRLHCVVFSAEPPDHACALLRVIQPLQRLATHLSHEWHAGTTDCAAVDAALARADLVIVQRFFACRAKRATLDRILRAGKPVLYETDDLLDALPPEHYLGAFSRDNRDILIEFVRRCDAVSVSTAPLAEAYRAYHPEVHVIPNHLDREHWFGDTLQHAPARPDGAPCVIGFFGTGTHQADLALVEPALARLADRHGPKLAFRFLGCITPALAALPNSSLAEGWHSYDGFPARLAGEHIDIGIAPLVDNPLNRCKSDLKWLEYAARGIAGVFSAVAPYASSVRDGLTGLVVENTADAWFDALDRLVQDAALRQRLAAAAHAEVRTTRTLDRGAERFLHAYRRTAAAQPAPDRADRVWDMVMRYEDRLAAQHAHLARLESELAWVDNSPPRRLLKRLRTLLGRPQSRPR
ncbi:MAG TPA: glycosyltransferase [Thauera sp.]|nr:glycosyltransferase [Thauera sp.]